MRSRSTPTVRPPGSTVGSHALDLPSGTSLFRRFSTGPLRSFARTPGSFAKVGPSTDSYASATVRRHGRIHVFPSCLVTHSRRTPRIETKRAKSRRRAETQERHRKSRRERCNHRHREIGRHHGSEQLPVATRTEHRHQTSGDSGDALRPPHAHANSERACPHVLDELRRVQRTARTHAITPPQPRHKRR